MTIKDIAQISGVSKSTVSRYLNGGSISKKNAEKIERVIKETGYKPNMIASRLKAKQSHLIGILVTELKTKSVGIILDSLQRELRKHGYQLFIMSNFLGEDNTISNLELLVEQGVDGIIFGASKIEKETLQYLATLKMPVLILGQKSEIFPYCKADDYQAGLIMGKYIKTKTQDKITYLSMPLYDLAAGKERLDGFLAGIGNKDEVNVIECDYFPSSVYKKRAELLAANNKTVVCASDQLALGLLKIIRDYKWKVPQDIQFAGFGNYDYTDYFALSITSIDLDYQQVGVNVANKITKLVEHKKISNDNNYHLKLMKRHSTEG